MHHLKLIFRASTPFFILLFFRFTGTTKAEYEANFRSVKGPVKGPYILLYENFDLVTNDSLRGGDNAYSKFTSFLMEHELYQPYREFSSVVKAHDLSWGTNQFDSLNTLPTETQWEALKAQEEGFVYSRDTILHSDNSYPVDVPVKLGVYRSVSARVFFSLGDHRDKLQIIFPEEAGEDDPYGLRKRIRMSRGGIASSKLENLIAYYDQLKAFTSTHTNLTVKRLNTQSVNARAYKVWDEWGDLIFEDEEGLEGLEYQTNENGMIDVLSGEGDGKFILWYDHWYMYLLMVIQVLLYLGVIDKIAHPEEARPAEASE